MTLKPNAQYNVAAADSLAVRIAGKMRRRMFERFLDESGIEPEETLLDVGVTSDRSYDSSNYVEAWYPHKDRITAAGIDDAGFLQTAYPGLTFVRADGMMLPFADNSFDHVHSSAVIEHVGNPERQRRFLVELNRVARKSVFVTTPNRWFPVEFHTVLPFVHWLPAPAFRWFLRHTGKSFFADEANLNLLSGPALNALGLAAGWSRPMLDDVKLLGWPSNLLLIERKVPLNSDATRPI